MEEFHQTFFEDTRDLLKQLEQAILTLESEPEDQEIIEEIFRVMHTIKGAANMFGFDLIGTFTHDIETIYDAVRNKQAVVDEVILNITFQAADHIHALLDDPALDERLNQSNHHLLRNSVSKIISEIEQGKKQQAESQLILPSAHDIDDKLSTYYLLIRPQVSISKETGHPLLFLIEDLKEQGPHKLTEHLEKKGQNGQPHIYWDMYLAIDKEEEELRNMFIFVEDDCEIEIFKLANYNLIKEEKFVKKTDELADDAPPLDINHLQNYVNELLEEIRRSKIQEISQGEKQVLSADDKQKVSQSASIRVATEKIDQLMNWVSELVTMHATIQSIAHEHKLPQLFAAAESMEIISNNLRDTVFSISLLPLDTINVKLKRLVRNLSKELGKEVDFRTEGSDTELDKNVIEALTDPLMHIIRNCIDHGLESPQERIQKGKPAHGYILLKAYYSGANVYIEVHDDGRGIDPEKIRAKAIEKGLIQVDTPLSREENYQLLFRPGFSTADKVSDVSGRGVGMDVVKKKIREIRGDVSIFSEPGRGTSISIRLPLTLSIMDGLLTQVDETYFVFPLNLISRIDKVPFTKINQEGKFSSSLVVEGKQMSVLSLREAFHMHENKPSQATIISIQNGEGVKGIAVDSVKGELQAVLKPLGDMYEGQDYISGCTILGDGNLALVLDTNKLIYHYASH